MQKSTLIPSDYPIYPIIRPLRIICMFFVYILQAHFSIVLMAVVDANYRFLYVDVGNYGKNSDGGIFNRCSFGRALQAGALNLPDPTTLPGGEELGPMPYAFVGDEAFPLLPNLMRPYPGKANSRHQLIFNKRLSRARRMVESSFGILAVRWRMFHTSICLGPALLSKVVKACCILHNIIQTESTPAKIKYVRDRARRETTSFHDLRPVAHRMRRDALATRDAYATYFTDIASLPWHLQAAQNLGFDEEDE